MPTNVGKLRLGSTRSYTSSMKKEPVRYRTFSMPLNNPTPIRALRQADKAEDLERMESVVDYDQDQQDATPDEESFDIF